MAESLTSTTPDFLSDESSPLEQGAPTPLRHHSRPVQAGRGMPTPYSRPHRHDRSRSHDADHARRGTARSDRTTQWNTSSVHAQNSTLQGTQTMGTTTFSNDLDAYALGAEDSAGPSSQSLVVPLYESAPSTANEHAQKDPITGDSIGWACSHGCRFEVGEPPMTYGERTIPPVEESPPPNARPMPGSWQLTRTYIVQQCNSACISGPTCQHHQHWSSAISPTVPRGRTIPDVATDPHPSARPLPMSRQWPRTLLSPTQHYSRAGSSVPTCPRHQCWSIGDPSKVPRSRTIPDAAEEPPPSQRPPQTRRRRRSPPGCRQWHANRAALKPGPDPLALRYDSGQAPAPPRPSSALRHGGLRANHNIIPFLWWLTPHMVEQLRLTHLGAEASLDPHILPPLAGTGGTGGDERDHSFRSPRDPSPHHLTPSPHCRARRRPRSRHHGHRWDPHRSPAHSLLGRCTGPERDLLLPNPHSGALPKLLPAVFPSGVARRRRRPPRAGPSSRCRSPVQGCPPGR